VVKFLGLVLAGLLLVGCDRGVDYAAPPSESLGNRFVVEAKAELGGRALYVVRDKETGVLLYLGVEMGVAVHKKESN